MTTSDPSTATVDGTALPRSTPEAQGVPSGAVLALVERWERRGLEPHSLALLRHGHLVAEGSWAPYPPDGVQLVYSVSKTFTACAVGFAVQEGLLRLTDRVVDLFPEAAGVAGPRAAALTLHDLLAMRTGHRADTLIWRESTPATFPATFLAAEPEEEPGWFVYHNGASLLAGLAVQRRSGERLTHYLRARLLDPLGVPEARWSAQDGLELGYSGLHVPTDALARLGELVRCGGRWQGRQLLPHGWAEAMTSVHTDTSHHPETADWQQGYGYQMWRCRHDAWRADGAFGQFSVVVPHAGLVLALTSCTERTQETLDAVWEELLPALADGPLPQDPQAQESLERRLAAARVPAPDPVEAAPTGSPGVYVHTPTEEVPHLERVEVTPAAGGWALTLLEDGQRLVVPCGEGRWPSDPHGPWTACGGWTGPDTFEAAVAAVQTPHVLRLRCAGGSVEAQWNGVPLTGGLLARQRAPR
ncbi:beta-lactamase family protein [Phycicoccus endophyticus]|uniref:Beta-lactamase family protein n=1 Tax=Phycicoccus endophyticus TaxID=1690220 RepID=A0A7G9R4Z8_9MICO|nr:serine hydrolase domain-containing protein [Phycicoccus endophyticus]NHI20940.1 beta-lactamase family protein [Phycicoccus endophyticus]QNN50673.1 beta-lactamase family protein [Phycicoccus endophyticus]GGL22496.1 hypothetical protein GCM10012283_00640 [Phycicoccus endophyticus]